jgi:hypothetical protein
LCYRVPEEHKQKKKKEKEEIVIGNIEGIMIKGITK